MSATLSSEELVRMIERVFQPTPADTGLLVLVDVPDDRVGDNPAWAERRRLAAGWALQLDAARDRLHLPRVTLAWYPNVGGNNADLPPACRTGLDRVPDHVADLDGGREVATGELLAGHSIVLAPTELSATAPLKVAARRLPLRAATMPGFLPAMIPALRLDYGEIDRRVTLLKELLDAAEAAEIRFTSPAGEHVLHLDLRHRRGHASGGLFPRNGAAGNLPSGEAYIVPYEGERQDDPSRTRGELPVRFADGLVVYRIERNRAVAVAGDDPAARREAELIVAEPAYANLAELGLGVLGDFGIEPCDSILLDEKLGLHIAFGRSDHFGGSVGPEDFSSPAAVVHQDRVYIPEVQPGIRVDALILRGPDGERRVMAADRWCDDVFRETGEQRSDNS